MFSCDSCELNGLAEYEAVLIDGYVTDLCETCLDGLVAEGVVTTFVRYAGLLKAS